MDGRIGVLLVLCVHEGDRDNATVLYEDTVR
jgi:hypothetical protein